MILPTLPTPKQRGHFDAVEMEEYALRAKLDTAHELKAVAQQLIQQTAHQGHDATAKVKLAILAYETAIQEYAQRLDEELARRL